MNLKVYSEIGRLREVLVHRPGPEVDSMPPSMMKELLFDDIIYGRRARVEHARFCAIMEKLGAVVSDAQDLLREALETDSAAVAELIGFITELEALDSQTVGRLESATPQQLSELLVGGVRAAPEESRPGYLFQLPPIPNLLFTRDAQVVLGDRVIISSMSRRARRREPLLSRFVFRHHPRFRGVRFLIDFSQSVARSAHPAKHPPSFEGGDVLVFHEGVVLVGVSERTMESAVDLLVESLRDQDTFHTLIMVPMPRARAAMHLDTVFTRVSQDECLVYAPMVLPGHHETVSVISINLRQASDWGARQPSLLHALRKAEVDLRPICCGGQRDYIRQTREQWTDGANSFALAPGIVTTYRRNEATAEEFARAGYEVLSVENMPFGPEGQCLQEFQDGKKYVILVAGEELSRARGGARCMTMPLVRDPVA